MRYGVRVLDTGLGAAHAILQERGFFGQIPRLMEDKEPAYQQC